MVDISTSILTSSQISQIGVTCEAEYLYFLRKIRGNRSPILITILLLAVIVTLPAIMTTTTNRVYGQPDQVDLNVTDSSPNIQNIPVQKVQIGDIDVAYKMFGKGDPIILFNGASDNMDAWDPSFISDLSSNHTVIVFDQRGIANTTIGSKPYTEQQLANDTAGLLDALKIPKADVMGYSLGSYLAQQLTMMYPDKVNTTTTAQPE
jgi:pimeloyl-ACP methyl ester carboxylesterase